MTIATVITFGYGSFGTVNFLPTLGYGDYGATPTPVVVPDVGIGNLDWLKVKGPRRPVRIKRSEFSTVEEYRDAVSKAAAALAVASVPVAAISPQTGDVIGDDILEDDEIILLALTRILH